MEYCTPEPPPGPPTAWTLVRSPPAYCATSCRVRAMMSASDAFRSVAGTSWTLMVPELTLPGVDGPNDWLLPPPTVVSVSTTSGNARTSWEIRVSSVVADARPVPSGARTLI